MEPFINTAIKAARLAGDIIMRGYGRLDTIQITAKGKKDMVTNIDIGAERAIIDTIHTAYPDHDLLGEESGATQTNKENKSDYEWIIDPLDGTTNFIHGIGHFCVSIALKYKGRLEHAVIYDPVRNDLFIASRGRGAFKNNRRIRIGQRTKLEDALIATGLPSQVRNLNDLYYEILKDLSPKSYSIRRCGASALDLAYVAAGQLDGFWIIGSKPWDFAAGVLLVKEAGGLVADFAGTDNYMRTGNIVCGNPKIFKNLVSLLKPLSAI